MFRDDAAESSPEPLDLGRLADLPEELQFLAEPAVRYRFEYEEQVLEFLEHATEEQLEELATLAERCRLNRVYPKVHRLYCNSNLKDTTEGLWLMALFLAMDHADLQFDDLDEDEPDGEEM